MVLRELFDDVVDGLIEWCWTLTVAVFGGGFVLF